MIFYVDADEVSQHFPEWSNSRKVGHRRGFMGEHFHFDFSFIIRFFMSARSIELDIHFVRERVVAGIMSILPLHATSQIADALTKPLGTTTFQDLGGKLEVVSTSHHPSA